MKTYEQFQDYLATQGIPHPISELGKQFALNELKYIHEDRIYPEDDLGKYEYRNMLSVEHAIDSIKKPNYRYDYRYRHHGQRPDADYV